MAGDSHAFVLSEAMRSLILHAATDDASLSARGIQALVLVEQRVKEGDYAQAARIAARGNQWRLASLMLRSAFARGSLSFDEIRVIVTRSFAPRDARRDPFLALAFSSVTINSDDDRARFRLLSIAANDADAVREEDGLDAALIPDREVHRHEQRLWAVLMRLVALTAMRDWQMLSDAARECAELLLAMRDSRLTAIAPLRAYAAAKLELARALILDVPFHTVDDHIAGAQLLTDADGTEVLGDVALACAIRGDLISAKRLGVLARQGLESAAGESLVLADALGYLDAADIAALMTVLEPDDMPPSDVHRYLSARLAYMRGERTRMLALVDQCSTSRTCPWVRAEAIALRMEYALAHHQWKDEAETAADDLVVSATRRTHAVRLAYAKSRFAESHLEGALRIARSVWTSPASSPRYRARALALGVVCCRELGDVEQHRSLLIDLEWLCDKCGMSEPWDEFPDVNALRDRLIVPSDRIRVRPPMPEPRRKADLTKREIAVVRSLSRHARAKDIAAELHVSMNTVKTQLRHAYRKLGVHSRDDAVRVAADQGLL